MSRISVWANFIGYQLAWFIVVSAAGHERPWVALLPTLAFICWQLAASDRRVPDLQLMAAALGCGLIVDGSLSLFAWLHYAAASPALPPGGAPLWILALWMSFSLTMPRSLAWLQGRHVLAVLLGAIGAPLAYLSAARGWNAVQFPAPALKGIAGLAAGWALAVPLLMYVAARGSAERTSAA
jgi:hypothetical protein